MLDITQALVYLLQCLIVLWEMLDASYFVSINDVLTPLWGNNVITLEDSIKLSARGDAL